MLASTNVGVAAAMLLGVLVGDLPTYAQEPILNPTGCESLLPLDPWDPAQPPEQSVLCHPPGGGCPASAAPEVLSVNSHGATLQAHVPGGYTQLRSVRIRATAMWDCDEAGTCQHSCSFARVDDNNPVHQMFGQIGRWGVGFHEKRYYIDYFKAGSTSGTP